MAAANPDQARRCASPTDQDAATPQTTAPAETAQAEGSQTMTELATQELAQARAARIRAGIGAYIATLDDIAAAYAQRDWVALGYADWQAYVDGEYGAERLRLTPEHRAKAVQELRLAGMSQRAIGSALGVSVGTVNADLSGVQDRTPAEIQGADGKTYTATRPAPAPVPTGPTCEACGNPLPDDQAKVGYLRCEGCDSEGDHYSVDFPNGAGACVMCHGRPDETPAPMPEPGPEASTSTGPGHNHPESRPGEAHAGPAPQPTFPRAAGEAPTGAPTPVGAGDPHADGDARRDAELDAALAGTIQRFRLNFATAKVNARQLLTFDIDRVNDVFAGNWDRDVGDLLNALDAWTAQVREAHKARQRAGLRLVSGGDR